MSSDDKIKSLLNKHGLDYKNFSLYKTAFTHPSYANEHNTPNNERLEYLGDAIVNFLVAEYLFHQYPDEPEGKLTKTRARFVCASANSEYAIELELNECLLLGKGEAEQGGKSKQSVLGDLFEAFLGAIYLDLGLEAVRNILKVHVFPKINISKDFFVDYKSKLQEYIQAESRKSVEYQIIKETGPAHDKTFTITVIHDKVKLGTGVGKSKKEAEQRAAQDALEKLAIN